eukprot:XP_001707104.1 Hypothetical protein GL50803_102476 [Giardia lamblia ATCC 50803]
MCFEWSGSDLLGIGGADELVEEVLLWERTPPGPLGPPQCFLLPLEPLDGLSLTSFVYSCFLCVICNGIDELFNTSKGGADQPHLCRIRWRRRSGYVTLL